MRVLFPQFPLMVSNILENYNTSQPGYWQWHGQDMNTSITTKLSRAPLVATLTSPLTLPLNSWQPLTCSPWPILSFQECSYKWNHTVCNLLKLDFFFTQRNSLVIHPGCVCITKQTLPFYLVFHGIEVVQLNHSLTERHLGFFPSFWLLCIKLL